MRHPHHSTIQFILTVLIATVFGCLDVDDDVTGDDDEDQDLEVLGDSNPFPANHWVEVATGQVHSCARRHQGQVSCWGKNGEAESPDGLFKSITAGWLHSCGIRTNGIAECWGNPDYGLEDTPDGEFVDLDAGMQHVCGIRADGSIDCWGMEDEISVPPPAGPFADIECGGPIDCALYENGDVGCWGSEDVEQLDEPDGKFYDLGVTLHSSCALRTANDLLECWGSIGPVGTPPPTYLKQIDVGVSAGCGTSSEGTISCWGNQNEVLNSVPEGAFLQVATSGSHACAIDRMHRLICWGENGFGECNVPSEY